MRRRVASFCAALLCIIYFITCGPTYASDTWVVDGNVDPWADLEALESALVVSGGQASEAPGDVVALEPPEDAAAPDPDEIAGDAGFTTFAMNDSVKFAPFSVGFNGSVVGRYFYSNSGSSFSTVFSASGQSWSYPGGYDWTAGGSGSAVAVHSFGSWSGGCFNTQLSVNLNPYLQYNLAPEYDFSSATGDVTISFVSRTWFRYCTSKDSIVYQYKMPSSVRFWSGVQWYDCSFDVVGSAGDSVTTVSLTIPYSEAVGITDCSFRFVFDEFSSQINMMLPSSSYTGYVNAAVCTEARTLSIYDDESNVPDDPGVDLGPITGLLESIVSFLTSIVTGIANIGNYILELPGKIWSFISDGLQALFIPSEEDMQEISDKYNGLFESKLGFVYQLFSFVVDSFGKFQKTLAAASSYTFTFPGISLPLGGKTVVIVPQQTVSLDNAVMAVVRPVVGTAVSIIAVLSFSSTAFDMVVAFMSGTSYFEFMASRREQDGE